MDEEKNTQDEELPQSEGGSPTSGDAIAQELLPVSLETEMRRSYLDYAMSVIVGRALPDVRDGLKPVHRRVLFAMKEIGNTHSNPTKKAARVVGEVLGKYHPHGDSAAYQTIVRMAQDFSMRYPLIYGQGNFGSIDGDSAAAMRYTEVRLEKIAAEMLADINEETVDFVPNFDNSEQEPVVLPTRLPELLINGSAGIAVGMATNIPPHNIRETVDACLHALENPDCSIESLIELMPAPDFPTGGIIFGLSGVHQGYRTGRGRVVMRAKTHLEEFGNGRTRIVVDEIPYMVNKRVMYERMHELWRDKKLEGISEMRDESTKQVRIAIDLKQGAMPEVVLNNLFKNTQMQESFGMNMVALVDGQPMLLNLKQMIEFFLAHRREVVTRRTIFRLRKAREAGHLLEGQAIALSNIDEFIRLIRQSQTVEEAQKALLGRGWAPGFAAEIASRAAENGRDVYPEGMEEDRGLRADGLYYLTKAQVDNILAMNLRRLTGLEREKILSDYRQTMERIFDLIDILAKPARVSAIIAEELRAIRDEFGDERRSTIDLNGDPNFNKRDLIPQRDMVVTLTEGGYVKSQELNDYNAQTRGGKGRNVQATTKDDVIEALFIANSHDIILCFSTNGRVYPIDVFDLPEGKANSRGRPIVNLLPLAENERISFILPIQGFDAEHFVVMATNKGTIKKTPLETFKNVRNKGIIATTLDEDEVLVGVGIAKIGDDVMLFSDAGKCVRFGLDEVRATGRTAHGVRGMRIKPGQSVIALVVVDDETKDILAATEHGYGKRTPVSEYTRHGRGVQGIKAISTSERNGKVVAACLVSPEDDIMMLSTGGKVIRTRAAEVSVYGRGASGVHLIRLGEDTLQSVRIVARTGEETDEDIDHLDIEIPEDADVEEPDDLDEELDVAADEADDDANAER
ncbi:DNA gyrase subunit A [Sutterella massiliensis]|uniref:DNA gyrase subunit A n=1 Tax=Sutterella massiliensis TaxID=1816689 RepID=A0ABS2DTP4_9BURK|nr:DNA gyrase subunit A [Sutterella massiliensis]MBM6704095.1 DNA gyrase subunit A [Sutterella massiliensis]